jgi:hypothetical protein
MRRAVVVSNFFLRGWKLEWIIIIIIIIIIILWRIKTNEELDDLIQQQKYNKIY